MLSDPTHNQETQCDYLANEVILTRTCSEEPCLLGVCSLGILADCDCREAGFTIADVGPKKFIDGTLCRPQNFVTQLGQPPIQLPILLSVATLTDSVSSLCGNRDGSTFCGTKDIVIYDADTDTEYSDSSIFTWNQGERFVTIQSISDTDFIGVHNLEVRVKLRDHKMTNDQPYFPHFCRFTLEVQPAGPPCKIQSISPFKQFQAFIYILGSGEKQFRLPEYTLVPECFTTFTQFLIEPIDPLPGIPIPTTNQKQISLSSGLQSLDGQVQLYRVTVGVYEVINTDLLVQISFFKDKKYLNQPPSLAKLPDKPDLIPCLSDNAAVRWIYRLPKVEDQEETEVKFDLKCLLLDQSFFLKSIADQVLTLTLNTEAKDSKSGFYSCTLTMTDAEGLESQQTLVFEKMCENPLTDSQKDIYEITPKEEPNKQPIEFQQAVIKNISKTGLLTLEWPESFRQINEQLSIRQLLNITIIPGKNSDPKAVILLGYTNTTFQDRFMKIQLEFQTPALMSIDQKSKERLVVSLNHTDFSIRAQKEVEELSIYVPRQIGPGAVRIDLGAAVTSVKNAAMIMMAIQNPVTLYLLQMMLKNVSTLAPITHYILFNLEYPLNLQEFFGTLAPLIYFDLIDTNELYEAIFWTSRFDDSPFTEQFQLLAYPSTQVINNIGLVLVFIAMQPVAIAMLKLTIRLLRSKTGKLSIIVSKFCQRQLDKLFWNAILQFYTEAYLFLSFVGWLQLKDQRWDPDRSSSEHFSTLLGYVLFAFSLTWPIIVHNTLSRNFKPNYPPIHKLTLERLRSEGSLLALMDKFHTKEQRQEYLSKYGAQIKNFRIDSTLFGIQMALFVKDLMFWAQLMLVVIIQFDNKFEKSGLLSMQFLLLLQLGYLISTRPFDNKLLMATEIFNLLTQLYLTYVVIVFTPFVPDHKIRQDAGNQYIFVTLINIGINMFLGLYPGARMVFMLVKKKLKAFANKYNRQAVLARKKLREQQLEMRNTSDAHQAQQDIRLEQQSQLEISTLVQADLLNAPAPILKQPGEFQQRRVLIAELPVLNDFVVDYDDVEQNTKIKWWDSDKKQDELLKLADDENSELRSDIQASCSDQSVDQDQISPAAHENWVHLNDFGPHHFNGSDSEPQNNLDNMTVKSDRFGTQFLNSDDLFSSQQSPLSQSKQQNSQLRQSHQSYVDRLLSESDSISVQEFRASCDFDFTKLEQRQVRLNPPVDFSNLKHWQRTEDRAFCPDPKASREQMQREANAYCEYIQSRLVVTQWDRYPYFEGAMDLTYQCVRAHSATLNLIKERNPTPQQRLKIEEQLQEVRMEVATRIVKGIIKETPQLIKEFKDEINKIKKKD